MTSLNHIIDQSKIYQLVTERLVDESAGNEPSAQDKNKAIDMNPALIALILDLYSDDTDFKYEKMREFSLEEILGYLQATHRYYLTKKLPEIEQSLMHIFSKYGQSHQLLANLAYFFNDYKAKLIDHVRMEERELFPYIQKLIGISKGEINPEKSALTSDFSIAQFMKAHSPIEDELQEVSQLIRRYSDEASIPLPYKIFLNQVEIFEKELCKHAIIEDHVLVPMALELEKKYT